MQLWIIYNPTRQRVDNTTYYSSIITMPKNDAGIHLANIKSQRRNFKFRPPFFLELTFYSFSYLVRFLECETTMRADIGLVGLAVMGENLGGCSFVLAVVGLAIF
jgi:hypothetical protein